MIFLLEFGGSSRRQHRTEKDAVVENLQEQIRVQHNFMRQQQEYMAKVQEYQAQQQQWITVSLILQYFVFVVFNSPNMLFLQAMFLCGRCFLNTILLDHMELRFVVLSEIVFKLFDPRYI
jgi:hypothetical protein